MLHEITAIFLQSDWLNFTVNGLENRDG